MYNISNGTEYYGVLSRENHPNWLGWQLIDYYKEKYGTFKECFDKCDDLGVIYKEYCKKINLNVST